MSKQIKSIKYTNPVTGEYKSSQYWVDMIFDDDGYLFWSNKNNVKTFLDLPLPKVFTWAEKGRINELKHYILRDNQFLAYRSNNGIKPLEISNMCKVLEISERQCRALIKKIKDIGIIKEVCVDGIKYFAFNPVYGFRGKRLSLNVFIFFQEELSAVLPKWVTNEFMLQAKELNPNIKIIK